MSLQTRKSGVIIVVTSILFGCATPSVLVTQHQRRGDISFNQHRYEEAANHYSMMIEESGRLGIYRNIPAEASVRRKLANCYEMTGDYESAIANVREAILLDSVTGNTLNLIDDYRLEGRILVYMGSFTRGIIALQKALSLAEPMINSIKEERRLALADTYLALGQLYAATGKYNDALSTTSLSIELYRQAGDKRGEMEALLNIGSVWSDLGDQAEAINYINRSLELASVGKMGIYRHHQLIASLMTASGRYEEAVRHQDTALDDARKFGIRGQIIWATIGLGDIYNSLGDNSRAEKFYLQAQRLKDTIPMQAENLKASLDMRMGEVLEAGNYYASENLLTGDGISSLRLAEIYALRSEFDSALVLLSRAGSAFRATGNKLGMANVALLKGRINVSKTEFAAAAEALDSAMLWQEFPDVNWKAHFYTGMMLEKRNLQSEAIQSYIRAIRIIEDVRGNLSSEEFRSIFLDTKREVYERLINLLIRSGDPDGAFFYSENARSRAFYEMLSGRKINFGGSAGDTLAALEQEKRNEITKLQRLLQATGENDILTRSGSESESETIRKALDKRSEEYNTILQQIRATNPEYAELIAAKPVTVGELKDNLGEGTAILSYWVSGENTSGWAITGDTTICINLGIGRDSLTAKVEELRNSIRSLSPSAGGQLRNLYEVLIGPFEKIISECPKIILIPNGPLHFLPFQALTNREGNPVVMNHITAYSPSAGVYLLTLGRSASGGTRFLGSALADIRIGDYPALPGTEDELLKIIQIFPENQFKLGEECSETFIKENAPSANLIHFATHGIYNRMKPLNSHLLFPPSQNDDGKLNVYEVFEMNLSASLVTLSACETGLGNLTLGDELTGLSRAFIYAGAGAVIVSLWPVADYPTALLMSKFYTLLSDYPMHEALTLAQRETMKTYSQPIYWSPFILIGNGNIRLF